MNILNQIKFLASKQGVSLAEVERKTNLSSGSITKWNKNMPSVDKLERVARYFDVSLDYLVGSTRYANALRDFDGIEIESESISPDFTEKEEQDSETIKVESENRTKILARNFRELDDSDKELLESIVNKMLNIKKKEE